MTLRKPNKKELRQLACYLYGPMVMVDVDYAVTDLQDMAEIAIMEDYVSDYNKYNGKLMLVISTFCPGGYALYRWQKEHITPVKQHVDSDTSKRFFLKARPCGVCGGKPTWKACVQSA